MDQEYLLQAIEIIHRKEGMIKPISSLAYHTDHVSEGALFVCIKGYKTDGHLYLEQAANKGAAAAVVERILEGIDIPQYQVADSRAALAALADRFYRYPSKKVQLTGVTATNGKTTTTYMINTILEKHGLNTGLIGTVIVKKGRLVEPAALTTPESLDLHRIFHEMLGEGVTHAVMEVSSSGLELKRVGSVDFDIVVVNNISREHIDLHGSFEEYFRAKASLARNAGADQWAVFNLDCPHTASLIGETKAKTFSYGLKNRNADCLVRDLDLSSGRARFTVDIIKNDPAELFAGQPHSFPLELSVLGLHSVYNSMAAVLVALLHDIPVATIREALKEFGGVERRFELIFEDEIKVIDDHFANSGNIHVTMETLRMMDYKRVHLVYAIRGSRGVTVNRENAEAVAYWAPLLGMDTVIATTSNSHVGEKDLVTTEEKHIFTKIMAEAKINTEIYDELPEAISRGLADAKPGDVVLLAGCQGMDYGAKICLEEIHRLNPHLEKEKIFAALNNRVAGID